MAVWHLRSQGALSAAMQRANALWRIHSAHLSPGLDTGASDDESGRSTAE